MKENGPAFPSAHRSRRSAIFSSLPIISQLCSVRFLSEIVKHPATPSCHNERYRLLRVMARLLSQPPPSRPG